MSTMSTIWEDSFALYRPPAQRRTFPPLTIVIYAPYIAIYATLSVRQLDPWSSTPDSSAAAAASTATTNPTEAGRIRSLDPRSAGRRSTWLNPPLTPPLSNLYPILFLLKESERENEDGIIRRIMSPKLEQGLNFY